MASSRTYLLHLLRKKLNYPDLKRAVRKQAELHSAGVVLIEDKASGTQLIQELAQEGMRSIKAYKPEASMTKEMRLNAQTGVIENGLVFVPEAAEWLDLYLHEMMTFPAGKHDDTVCGQDAVVVIAVEELARLLPPLPQLPPLVAFLQELELGDITVERECDLGRDVAL